MHSCVLHIGPPVKLPITVIVISILIIWGPSSEVHVGTPCVSTFSSSSYFFPLDGSPQHRMAELFEIRHTDWGQLPDSLHQVSCFHLMSSSATSGSNLEALLSK